MLLSCLLWLFYVPFISFFGTNLLIQCQVPVPVFSVFLTLFRSDFGTESKRKKNLEMIFSRTEEDQGAFGPSQVGSREPTSPHSSTTGRRRWAGLWPPWPPPDLGFWPINSQIFRKKSGEPQKYFSAASSFRFPEISCGDPSRHPAGGDFGVGGLVQHHHRPSNDS